MAVNGNKVQHYKTIAQTCYGANILYLILHIVYLIFFLIAKANILVYINAGIIAFYLLCFLLIKRRKYYYYALLCGNVFFAFVSVSAIMLGFNSGFQLHLIGLCVVSFFTSYFSKRRRIGGSILWVILSFGIFITLYFVCKNNPPYYFIDSWMETTLFIIHSLFVFGFVAVYLVIFLRYAFSLEKKIMNESRTDELTQINNRYGLYDYFEETSDKANLVLALFDIDDFKKINDTYGHVTGDYVLKEVARLASTKVEDGFICRYGGEEFVFVLDNHKNDVVKKLEFFKEVIQNTTFEFNGVVLKITVTIGASKFNNNFTLERWVEEADKKMYQGKNSGKDKVVF